MQNTVEIEVIESILRMYGFHESISEQKSFIHDIGEDGYVKLIFRVTLENGRMLVIKIQHEEDDPSQNRQKVEKQSRFSEFMRSQGIKTPARYRAEGRYCNEFVYRNIPCNVTVEDWCGEEIKEINVDIAYRIGKLMAQMHMISFANQCGIGCGTLFSAAYWNDVDVYPKFCEICEDKGLDQETAAKIKALREEKLARIRAVWDALPKAAVQGDISINNLVYGTDELAVFDYNNAGDEVLVSDLVMEGLLTAYEMELPDGIPASYRENIFPALLKGYLSVRSLSNLERDAAWEIYTLYHGLWFTRIVYNDDSLEKLVKRGDYDTANRLLYQMLLDMTEPDDGRFSNLQAYQKSISERKFYHEHHP